MAVQQHEYSVQYAYNLGDQYKRKISTNAESKSQSYLAALLCYKLPTITLHPLYNLQNIQSSKLSQLNIIKQEHDIIIDPNKQYKMPPTIKRLLRSFYKPWLNELKQKDLKQRAIGHTEGRAKAIMKLFNETINEYNITDIQWNIQQLQTEAIEDHLETINTKYEGPDFQHLKQRVKSKYPKNREIETENKTNFDDETEIQLTAVYGKDGFLERCKNSQEEWFRKHDGKLIAESILEITQSFDNYPVAKVQFACRLLTTKVQFPKARRTELVPNSWIFAGKLGNNVILNNLFKLVGIDNGKKQQLQPMTKPEMRAKLISWCEEIEQRVSRQDTDMQIEDNMSHDTSSFVMLMNNDSNISVSRQIETKEDEVYDQADGTIISGVEEHRRELQPGHHGQVMENMPIPNNQQNIPTLTGQHQQRHNMVFNGIIRQYRSGVQPHHISGGVQHTRVIYDSHPMLPQQHQSGHRAFANNAYSELRQHQMQQMAHHQHQNEQVHQQIIRNNNNGNYSYNNHGHEINFNHENKEETSHIHPFDTIPSRSMIVNTNMTTEVIPMQQQPQRPQMHTTVVTNIINNYPQQMNIDQNAHHTPYNGNIFQINASRHSHSNSADSINHNHRYPPPPDMYRSHSAPINHQHSHRQMHGYANIDNMHSQQHNTMPPFPSFINQNQTMTQMQGNNNNGNNMQLNDSVVNDNDPGNNSYDSNNNGVSLQHQQIIHRPQITNSVNIGNIQQFQTNNNNNFNGNTQQSVHSYSGDHDVDQHMNSTPMTDGPHFHYGSF